MEDNGEIEYFEFVPINFVNEMQEQIEALVYKNMDELKTIDSSKHKKIKEIVQESCKKNLFIFKNFVMRNILTFPKKFVFERKKTDLVVEGDVNEKIEEYIKIKNEQGRLIEKINKLNVKKKLLEYENNKFNEILEKEFDLRELSLNLVNIRSKYAKAVDFFNKIPFHMVKDDEEFNSLLEYRELRSEALKKERDELQSRIDQDFLENIL